MTQPPSERRPPADLELPDLLALLDLARVDESDVDAALDHYELGDDGTLTADHS